MGEITLKIEEDVLDRLRAQAVIQGHSVEDEVLRLIAERFGAESVEQRERRELREKILSHVAEQSARPRPRSDELLRRAREIASMSPPLSGIDIAQLIREDRDR